jgi:hypothetical protein
VEKADQNLRYFRNFQTIAQSKQSANGLKFAQSGNPDSEQHPFMSHFSIKASQHFSRDDFDKIWHCYPLPVSHIITFSCYIWVDTEVIIIEYCRNCRNRRSTKKFHVNFLRYSRAILFKMISCLFFSSMHNNPSPLYVDTYIHNSIGMISPKTL